MVQPNQLLPDPRAELLSALNASTYRETPAYVIDLGALRDNLRTLADVQARSGAKVLLALKGFATWGTFPIVREYLSGVTASSPHEARLGREELGKEVHGYAPAYSEADIAELVTLTDHLVMNSVPQWRRHRGAIERAGISTGLRVNPEHSEVETPLYDPCAPGSRLGTTAATLEAELAGQTLLEAGFRGLHFHTLCELGSDALERTVKAVEERFGRHLVGLDWVNFGGRHHITRPDYDRERLVRVVREFAERHGVQVYLEPGEAVALNTGVLVAQVEDVLSNGQQQVAILDCSATAHMPDVLEMPYRPKIMGAAEPGEKAHTYRLGGMSCLAGDVIGDYAFDEPLRVGSRLVFTDMIHYTMVKTTTFNGVKHPSIVSYEPSNGELRVLRRFGYEDYKRRLG